MTPGQELIKAERLRQIEVEGWTAEHDKEHSIHHLAAAAGCYWRALDAQAPSGREWPWDLAWWKPKDRLRNLVRSGALYMAAHDLAVRRHAIKSAELFLSQSIRVGEAIDQEFPNAQESTLNDHEKEHWKDAKGLCVPQCAVCKANLRAGLNPDGTPRTPGLAYLIQTRDGYWWRPEGGGYTSNILEAGVYAEKEALCYLGEPYGDRNDSVTLARPHLERAAANLKDRMAAIAAVESGETKRA